MIDYKNRETVPLPSYGKRPIGNTANMGLVFNKYFPWNKSDRDISKSDGWVRSFVSEFNSITPSDEYGQRYRKMVISNEGTLFELECLSDIIIGMGNAHPLENGFTFDHAQGLPFIPGTTIKGIWKASKRTKQEEDKTEGNERGNENEAIEERDVDDFIFLDAIPLSVKLKLDIMTPHYQPYYASTEPPGDYYNPIPIQFVAVSKGSKFLWGLITRTQKDTKETESLLREWFNNFGIGGKTAVGYGRIRMRVIGGKKS